MHARYEQLAEEFRDCITDRSIAMGSLVEALGNGQFDRARAALDDYEAAHAREQELEDAAASLPAEPSPADRYESGP